MSKLIQKNQFFRIVLLTILVVMLIVITPTYSQNSFFSKQTAVKLGDKTLFIFLDKFLYFSVEKSSEKVTDIIVQFADNYFNSLETLTIEYADIASIIHAENLIIFSVSDTNAKVVNLSHQVLTNQYLKIIKNAIPEYRQEQSFTYLIRTTSAAVIYTIILIFLRLILLETTGQSLEEV